MFEKPPDDIENEETNNVEEDSFIPQKSIFETIRDNWREFKGLEKEKREQCLNEIQDPEAKDKMTNCFFAFTLAENVLNKLDK